MEKIDKLIRDYYLGTLTQSEMNDLCRMFLDDDEIRMEYPDESRVLVPLALARMSHRRQKKNVRRAWAVAASIAIILLLGGGLYAHIANVTHVYVNDPAFIAADVEQWYDKTLETAV